MRAKNIRGLAVLMLAMGLSGVTTAHAQRQMEKLGRGVVALHAATAQAYLAGGCWRTTPPASALMSIVCRTAARR